MPTVDNWKGGTGTHATNRAVSLWGRHNRAYARSHAHTLTRTVQGVDHVGHVVRKDAEAGAEQPRGVHGLGHAAVRGSDPEVERGQSIHLRGGTHTHARDATHTSFGSHISTAEGPGQSPVEVPTAAPVHTLCSHQRTLSSHRNTLHTHTRTWNRDVVGGSCSQGRVGTGSVVPL